MENSMPSQGGNKVTPPCAFPNIMMSNIDPRHLRLFQPSISHTEEEALLRSEIDNIPRLKTPSVTKDDGTIPGESADDRRSPAPEDRTRFHRS